jgi:hypothetical protein
MARVTETTEREMARKRRLNGGPLGPDGFDVTCVIGRVNLTEDGEHSPHEAAFLLIAAHDAPGTYTFPLRHGGDCRVTVEYPDWPDSEDG